MADSGQEREQFTSESFIESAGAVLFRLSSQEICIIHSRKSAEGLLPKGRRRCGESRRDATVREVGEETGYASRLLPLTMATRTPPATENEPTDDKAHVLNDICEPFAFQLRRLDESNVKLIWWFVAAINEDVPLQERSAADQERYDVAFYSYTEVLDKLTFQMDRDMVKKAIELVTSTYAPSRDASSIEPGPPAAGGWAMS